MAGDLGGENKKGSCRRNWGRRAVRKEQAMGLKRRQEAERAQRTQVSPGSGGRGEHGWGLERPGCSLDLSGSLEHGARPGGVESDFWLSPPSGRANSESVNRVDRPRCFCPESAVTRTNISVWMVNSLDSRGAVPARAFLEHRRTPKTRVRGAASAECGLFISREGARSGARRSSLHASSTTSKKKLRRRVLSNLRPGAPPAAAGTCEQTV